MEKVKVRGMTAKQWGLYDDAEKAVGAAGLRIAVDALNQALRAAAVAVQGEADDRGGLRGGKLDDAIERALYDHWEDVAASYKKTGADDTEVRERAAKALRRLFRGVQEGVGMGHLLSLAEAKRAIPSELSVTEATLQALAAMDRDIPREMVDVAEADEELRKAYYAFRDGQAGFEMALNAYRKRVRAAWNEK